MAKRAQYRKFTRSTAGNIGYFTILILFGLFTVFPLFYCIITSLKPLEELLIFPPKFYVVRPTLDNFRLLLICRTVYLVACEDHCIRSLFVDCSYSLLKKTDLVAEVIDIFGTKYSFHMGVISEKHLSKRSEQVPRWSFPLSLPDGQRLFCARGGRFLHPDWSAAHRT